MRNAKQPFLIFAFIEHLNYEFIAESNKSKNSAIFRIDTLGHGMISKTLK